jgi:hypothetical protein
MKNKTLKIVVVDVGFAQAGFGGMYSVCMRKLKRVFGPDRVKGAYGSGFGMDQGMYVIATVKEIKDTLGVLTKKVTVKRATGVVLWLAKGRFGLPRSALKL